MTDAFASSLEATISTRSSTTYLQRRSRQRTFISSMATLVLFLSVSGSVLSNNRANAFAALPTRQQRQRHQPPLRIRVYAPQTTKVGRPSIRSSPALPPICRWALQATEDPVGRQPEEVNGKSPQQSSKALSTNATAAAELSQPVAVESQPTINATVVDGMMQRITQLEQIVSMQEVEIVKLKKECETLMEATTAFGDALELLRAAGLEDVGSSSSSSSSPAKKKKKNKKRKRPNDDDDNDNDSSKKNKKKNRSSNDTSSPSDAVVESIELGDIERTVEYFDTEIFGSAPRSVMDAADGAGAAILAGLLGGKQRMLVDVRDAELSRDPEALVQFVELAILPVAAGLEGLKSKRNRVKIVFPTVSQLLEYRKTMALAAPEVVALSTLGFEPVEQTDNLVVLVAPAPDDEEGLMAMNDLLAPSSKPVRQPLVVINHHMMPVSGPAADFEVAYHLRLLSVQYMSEDKTSEILRDMEGTDGQDVDPEIDEDALEAAMQHAREIGRNQGVTRAMVIRAYPKPWHVFVDTSPDTDADYTIADTFDEEPTQDDVNFAIVECLEGSEREDQIVAQQMQQALEDGQLDQVANMLGSMPPLEVEGDDTKSLNDFGDDELTIDDLDLIDDDEEDDDDDFFDDYDLFEEDSV